MRKEMEALRAERDELKKMVGEAASNCDAESEMLEMSDSQLASGEEKIKLESKTEEDRTLPGTLKHVRVVS